MARAEAADQADVADGMSIPDELARREERLAKLAEARAKIEARARRRTHHLHPPIHAFVHLRTGGSRACAKRGCRRNELALNGAMRPANVTVKRLQLLAHRSVHFVRLVGDGSRLTGQERESERYRGLDTERPKFLRCAVKNWLFRGPSLQSRAVQ